MFASNMTAVYDASEGRSKSAKLGWGFSTFQRYLPACASAVLSTTSRNLTASMGLLT
jgi:hypothetical protein